MSPLPFDRLVLIHHPGHEHTDGRLCWWVAECITIPVRILDMRFIESVPPEADERTVVVGGYAVRKALGVDHAIRGIHRCHTDLLGDIITCFGSGPVETGVLLTRLAFDGFNTGGW